MAIEITSRNIVSQLKHEINARVTELAKHGQTAHLAVILVGNNPQSEKYVASIKQRQAEAVGIEFTVHRLAETVTTEAVIAAIKNLNSAPNITGIIVQLPLPELCDTDPIINSVALEKDVDGLRQDSPFIPPTVSAILDLLAAYDIPLTDKKIVIVGQGRLVGQPLLRELKALKLDVTACDELTENLTNLAREADILISATGQPKLIRPKMVKEGAVVIDADHDADYEQLIHKVGAITPPVGAVGPLTVCHLMKNVVDALEQQAHDT